VRTSYDALSAKMKYFVSSAPLLPINALKTGQKRANFEFYLTHIGFCVKGHQNAYVRPSYDGLSSKIRYHVYSAPLLPINALKTGQKGAYFEFYLTHIGFVLFP